jgi:ABC-2 type transport system permease protein
MRGGNAPEVMVVYDGTYMVVAAGAKAAMSEIIQTVKAGHMLKVYESKYGVPESEAFKMIRPFEPVYRILFNPARTYRNFFLPGLITAIIQVGIVIIGLERAKEEKTKFSRDVVKISETGLIGALSIAANMALQNIFFGMPFRGVFMAFAVLTILFSTCMAAFGYIFGKAIPDKILSTQLACLFVLPAAILGGYTFPLMAMPDFFNKLRIAIPFSYYGESLRNLTVKELGVGHFTSDIFYYGFIKIVSGCANSIGNDHISKADN